VVQVTLLVPFALLSFMVPSDLLDTNELLPPLEEGKAKEGVHSLDLDLDQEHRDWLTRISEEDVQQVRGREEYEGREHAGGGGNGEKASWKKLNRRTMHTQDTQQRQQRFELGQSQ
jgi:hypothetical protein